MSSLRRLLRDASPSKGETAASVALGFGTYATGIGLMAMSAYLIQRASLRPPVLSLAVAIVLVRLFGTARGVLRYLERLVSHDAALRLLGRLRGRFYRALVPLAPGGLRDRRSGDVLRRVVADVDSLQDLFLRALGPPAVAALTGALAVGVVGAYAPAAGATLAVALVLGGVALPWAATRLGRRQAEELVAARARLSSEVVDALRAGPELVLWGAADAALDRIGAVDRAVIRLVRVGARRAALLEGLAVLVAGSAVVAVLAAGTAAVAAGSLDGVLLGVLALTAMGAFDAVTPLPAAFQTIAGVRAAADRLYELVDAPPPVTDPTEPLPAPERPELCTRGAGVRYRPTGPWALAGLDLDLGPGRRVAIVGPSGAGKSTVVNLLERFVPPSRGTVSVGGPPGAPDAVDVARLRQDDVRALMALAGQDGHVFAGSIAANLRLARPDATDDELVAVLDAVHLGDWVRALPDGLDSELGDDGGRASGGQRQRLLLARALLHPAPVIVLDEPTAHLDDDLAEALLADVVALTGPGADGPGSGRGLLLITHRLEGLEAMDEVVVLADGEVVERGPIAEVLAAGGRFASLWSTASSQDERVGTTDR